MSKSPPADNHGAATLFADLLGGDSLLFQVSHLLLRPFQLLLEAGIEYLQSLHPALLPLFYGIQLFLHPGGVPHIEEVGEVLHQQVGDQAAELGGDKALLFFFDISPLLNGGKYGSVSAGASNPLFLQLFHHGGFGIARRRLGEMLFRGNFIEGQALTWRQRGKRGFGRRRLFRRKVEHLLVNL